jgi:hypothetical protein
LFFREIGDETIRAPDETIFTTSANFLKPSAGNSPVNEAPNTAKARQGKAR